MASSINSDSGDMGFQIAPMVDVVFVLLLFFMACAAFKEKEAALALEIPGKGLSTPATIVFIDVDSLGQVSVNDRIFATAGERDLSSLSEWLRDLSAEYGQDPVVIRPTGDARHERIMAVLSACRKAKVQKVSFS